MKDIEIFLRKILLRILLLFYKAQSFKNIPKLTTNDKILLIRLNRIGDALISTPLIYLIKNKIRCKVIILASKNNHFIFNAPNLIDEIWIYDKKVNSLKTIIKKINKEHFDFIVDLHDDVSTTVSLIIAFSKAKYKIGFKKENFSLFNFLIEKPETSKNHIIDRMLKFADIFGIQYNQDEINIKYYIEEKSLTYVNHFLYNNNLINKFLLGINISAGNDARFWSIENYIKIIKSLKNFDINILLLCEKKDFKNAMEISKRNIPIFYNKSFNIFSAMISKLNLLISPDTSIIHIASAFNIPVFGLYVKYKTKDMIWSPYKSLFDCIITEGATLKNVSYEEVIKKLIPFLERIYNEYNRN